MPGSDTSSSTRSHELDRLERIAAEHDARQEVLIRITPGVAGDTHHAISTGQADSKFGFAVDQAPEAIARLAAAPHLELVGLHFHIGSQLLRARAVPRRGQDDRDAGRLPRLQPRRRPRGGLHGRPAASVDRRVHRHDRDRRARGARTWQAAAVRTRARARGQLDRHAVHGAVGQAQRLDLGGGRRRHVRQSAADALRGAATRRWSPTVRLRARASGATSPASTASRAT